MISENDTERDGTPTVYMIQKQFTEARNSPPELDLKAPLLFEAHDPRKILHC